MIIISVKESELNVKACARNMTAKSGLAPNQFDEYECFAHSMHLLLTKDLFKHQMHEAFRIALQKGKSTHRDLS